MMPPPRRCSRSSTRDRRSTTSWTTSPPRYGCGCRSSQPCWVQAALQLPRLARQGVCGRRRSHAGNRGLWRFERQGQARARLDAELPQLAAGVCGGTQPRRSQTPSRPSLPGPADDSGVRDFHPHGMSAVIRVPARGGLDTSSRPPSASSRSARPPQARAAARGSLRRCRRRRPRRRARRPRAQPPPAPMWPLHACRRS